MATKTYKIGEYAMGGIITVTVNGKTITVIGKQWDFSKGTRKSSDQSNAKEFTRKSFKADNDKCYNELNDFLCYLTTSYWADQIINWIETKVEIKKSLWW